MMIDDLLQINNRRNYHILNGDISLQHILESAKAAIPIEISNIDEYFIRNCIDESSRWNFDRIDSSIINIAPPFPNIWFEWCGFRTKRKNSVLLISSKTENGWKCEAIEIARLSDVAPQLFANYYTSNDLIVTGALRYEVDCNGLKVDGSTYEINDLLVGNDYGATFVMGLQHSRALIGIAITFMHCKNVQLIENKPPEKLQKARIRRKKIPLVTHYTLEISPAKKILSEKGNIEKTGIKQALHICRGHFKDYRDGSGLFGKYKGLYWWESQVRGSKDEGMIIKDYKVNPPKEVACK